MTHPREAHEGDLPRHAVIDQRLLVAVFAGGMLGAAGRVGLDRWHWLAAGAGDWPWATFAANIAGAFVLGLAATAFQERLAPATLREAFAGPGLCGALTTFSTLQVEVIRLAQHDSAAFAAAYAVTSLAAGLAAVVAGTTIARTARAR